MRQLGDNIDLSAFDYQAGRHQMLNPNAAQSASAAHYQRAALRRTLTEPSASGSSPSPSIASSSSSSSSTPSSVPVKQHPLELR